MTAHDPFIQLSQVYIDRGRLVGRPLILRPEDVKEMADGKVFIAGSYYDVKESALEMKAIVIAKLEENREAETLGK